MKKKSTGQPLTMVVGLMVAAITVVAGCARRVEYIPISVATPSPAQAIVHTESVSVQTSTSASECSASECKDPDVVVEIEIEQPHIAHCTCGDCNPAVQMAVRRTSPEVDVQINAEAEAKRSKGQNNAPTTSTWQRPAPASSQVVVNQYFSQAPVSVQQQPAPVVYVDRPVTTYRTPIATFESYVNVGPRYAPYTGTYWQYSSTHQEHLNYRNTKAMYKGHLGPVGHGGYRPPGHYYGGGSGFDPGQLDGRRRWRY